MCRCQPVVVGCAPLTPPVLRGSNRRCVHDVAVGNADMCLGDFWVTPQRLNLANFLTPFDNDNFYLVAPRASGDEPLGDILMKPFLPFSNMLWGVTLLFLCFSAFVMMVTDSHNIDDYNNQGKVPIIFKSLYFAFAGSKRARPRLCSRALRACWNPACLLGHWLPWVGCCRHLDHNP